MKEIDQYKKLNKLASRVMLVGLILVLLLAITGYRELATIIAPFLIILMGLCGILGYKSGEKVWIGGFPIMENASNGARQGALFLNIFVMFVGFAVLFK